MNNSEPNLASAEELETPPTRHQKPLSWSRNPRTSCDSCKQMKIRCERNDGKSCTRCVTRKLACTTTPVERKKRKVTKKKEEYFDEMEDRIKRMESAIIASTLHGTAEAVQEKEDEKSSFDKIESQAGISNHLSNLIVDPEGSPNFIGWASGFSLFSPKGLRWISEKVGDEYELSELFGKMSIRGYDNWGRTNDDLWSPLPRSQHAPIPSKDVALQYVNSFFLTFNNVFPVINKKLFNTYFDRQYSTNPPASTAWYALFNVVLCLGNIRMKADQEKHINSYIIDHTSVANGPGVEYFRNASCCYHDLIFKEANLMAMQAMVLMMYITTSSPNPQPAYVLASAAGNLANTLGLHRSYEGISVAPEEIEQRRNVFWVFYLMEKAISRNLGRPSVINDDDIAIALPPKNAGLIQSPSRGKAYDIFQEQITLAIIGSRICSELYTASSQTKSEAHRMKVLGKLDTHLQRWRDAVPIDIRPEHPIKCSNEQYVPILMMHLVYLDAVILLHRLSGHQESFNGSQVLDIKDDYRRSRLNPRIHASQLLCLAAARRSIQLLDTFSNNKLQNQYLRWMAVYYPLSASLVLFSNILSSPQDDNAASDLHLTGLITSFIDRSVQPGTSFAATPTLNLFKELHAIATRVVAKTSPHPRRKLKRQPESDDPIQADIASSPGISLEPDTSVGFDLHTQDTTLFDAYDSTTHSETIVPQSNSSLFYNSQQTLQENQYIQSTSSTKPSQESTTDDSPLEFAPFMPSEPNQLDYNSTIYDSFLSPTRFEWDMADMWIPDFAPDPGALADLIGLNEEPDIL